MAESSGPRGEAFKCGGSVPRTMAIRSVELTSIEARRFSRTGEKVGAIRIDHNSTVTLVKETTPTEASVEFRYTATFGGIGLIRLEGNLVYQGDAKALEAQWRQQNQMANAIASEIHTSVMRVCVPEAVGIARDLNLPPPIPLPAVKFEGQKPAGPSAPVHGPEVA